MTPSLYIEFLSDRGFGRDSGLERTLPQRRDL